MRTLLAVLLLAAALPALAQKKSLDAIPPGYRAVTLALPLHEIAYLEAGDRVDVITVFDMKPTDKSSEEVAATIFQNVYVFDLDKPRGFVRLLMNPNEAQYAALYSGKTIKLAVRAKGDAEMHPMEMAASRKLYR
jgi:Flp pilus assembly protein CpaB